MSISLGIADFAKRSSDCDIDLHIGTCITPIRVYCKNCSLFPEEEYYQMKVDGETWCEIENQWKVVFSHVEKHKENGDKIPWYVEDMLYWHYQYVLYEKNINGPFGRFLKTMDENRDKLEEILDKNIEFYNKIMRGSYAGGIK